MKSLADENKEIRPKIIEEEHMLKLLLLPKIKMTHEMQFGN